MLGTEVSDASKQATQIRGTELELTSGAHAQRGQRRRTLCMLGSNRAVRRPRIARRVRRRQSRVGCMHMSFTTSHELHYGVQLMGFALYSLYPAPSK
jgi:hypothetical protein